MIDFPRSDFWDYSIKLYAEKEVAEACLRLQDRHGLDVNVVLFCVWVAASGRGTLRGSEPEDAFAAVEVWHEEVVRRLRALRKWLKGDIGSAPRLLANQLRRAVLATELDAEHVEQLMLADCVKRPAAAGEPAAQARDALANLSAYFAAIGVSPSDADRTDARVVLAAAFPELTPGRISELARLDSAAG